MADPHQEEEESEAEAQGKGKKNLRETGEEKA